MKHKVLSCVYGSSNSGKERCTAAIDLASIRYLAIHLQRHSTRVGEIPSGQHLWFEANIILKPCFIESAHITTIEASYLCVC